jgi:hypothetical protein
MTKRIARPLSDVAKEVLDELKSVHGVTDKQLDQLRERVRLSGNLFPLGGIKVARNKLWIDYAIQREPIIKHILNLLKKWDNRICQPLACYAATTEATVVDNQLTELTRAYIYDAQHRALTLSILGFDEVCITLCVTDNAEFGSFAFRESNSTVKKIGPPDYHRNNLRLYDLGRKDPETISAHNLQAAFDACGVDLLEGSERKRLKEDERRPFWFSHFKYAQAPMNTDIKGETVVSILTAMTTAWPKDEEMDNCVFIGLNKMNEMTKSLGVTLPEGWMTLVCVEVAKSFKNSRDLSRAAERQVKELAGGNWSVPESMYKFMRELYVINGGTMSIPSDGKDLDLAGGIWVDPNLIPNKKSLYKPNKFAKSAVVKMARNKK